MNWPLAFTICFCVFIVGLTISSVAQSMAKKGKSDK